MIAREVPGTALWFATYETALGYADEPTPRAYQVIGAGAISGIIYNSVMFPVDTIKTRLQTITHQTVRFDRVIRDIYYQNGIPGFYRGLFPTLARAIPGNGAVFYCYEMISRLGHDTIANMMQD